MFLAGAPGGSLPQTDDGELAKLERMDAAYIHQGRFWPIKVKWTAPLRPKDLKQISNYTNAVMASRVQAEHRIGNGVVVLPLPVVLLRVNAATATL